VYFAGKTPPRSSQYWDLSAVAMRSNQPCALGQGGADRAALILPNEQYWRFG
jgi:hypothetical protein